MNRVNGKMRGNDPTDYLQKSSRRRILSLSAGALATGFAGCIGSPDSAGSDTDSTESPSDTPESSESEEDTTGHTWIDDPFSELNSPREEGGSDFEVSGRATLDPGFFTEIELPLTLPSQVSVNVSTGEENMDVYLLSGRKFNQYVEGKDVDFSETYAVTNADSVEEIYQAEPGTYNFVFDNSSAYGSQPEGSVPFEFQIGASASNPLIKNIEPPEIVESASQPRIVEIQDNLGHTFSPETARIEDEVQLTDDTIIKLKITKIAADEGDEITYYYDFLERTHRYDTNRYVDTNGWAWDLRREDYVSQLDFRILIRNQDDIHYRGGGYDADDGDDVKYSNLVLD